METALGNKKKEAPLECWFIFGVADGKRHKLREFYTEAAASLFVSSYKHCSTYGYEKLIIVQMREVR